MFEGSSEVIESARPTWDAPRDWRTVDRKLRAIAKQRGVLDADEARWLREAERLEIWRPLGMVSALDYLERVLGYTPHAARERLRVAHAVAELPAIAESFAQGELPFSAVRARSRDATVGNSHGNPASKLDDVVLRTQTRDVLVGLGWKASIARSAVDAAASHVGHGADLNVWVREALRHCPLPPGARIT